jgi:hypothetical protein
MAKRKSTKGQTTISKHTYKTKDPASSTTKTGRHDIAEILLKVALKTKFIMITPMVSAISSITTPTPY